MPRIDHALLEYGNWHDPRPVPGLGGRLTRRLRMIHIEVRSSWSGSRVQQMRGFRRMEHGGRFQVGIVVRDLDSMVAFYEHVLGLEHFGDLELPGALMKRFVLGDAGLKLLAYDEAPTVASAPGGPDAGASGLRYLTVEVPDVAEAVERCVAAGRSVPMPLFEFEPGNIVAIVEGPEGNWVELIQPE